MPEYRNGPSDEDPLILPPTEFLMDGGGRSTSAQARRDNDPTPVKLWVAHAGADTKRQPFWISPAPAKDLLIKHDRLKT
jgi:hypothetical protein